MSSSADSLLEDGSAQGGREPSEGGIWSHRGHPGIGNQQNGLRRVAGAGIVSYERLPMLEVVFDRLVRILSASFRNLTGENVEVSIDNLSSVRFGDYMGMVPPSAVLSVFRAEQWDSLGLIVTDASAISLIVDLLLGGRLGTGSSPVDGRPYTTIERMLVERTAEQVLQDLATSFAPLCKVSFRYERTEVISRFASVSRPSNAAVLARLHLAMGECGGSFEIVLPYGTLEPVRDLLLQQFMGERFGRDDRWERHLADELRETVVELDAVLGEQPMNLSEILALKIGSQIVFSLTSDDPVQLRCGGVSLFLARTGNRRSRIAVQIEERLPTNREMQGADSE